MDKLFIVFIITSIGITSADFCISSIDIGEIETPTSSMSSVVILNPVTGDTIEAGSEILIRWEFDDTGIPDTVELEAYVAYLDSAIGSETYFTGICETNPYAETLSWETPTTLDSSRLIIIIHPAGWEPFVVYCQAITGYFYFKHTNHPPEIINCPDETLEIIIGGFSTWLAIDFYDPDGDEIFCNVFEYPESYSHWGAESTYYWGFGGSGSIRFAFYPSISDTGLYHFAFEACDSASGSCDTCGFWVRVLSPENHPPEISGCPEDTVYVMANEEEYWFVFEADDIDDDTLYFSWVEHPEPYDDWHGTWWSDTNEFEHGYYWGEIGCYPTSEDTGTYNFVFSVCDFELCDTCEFVVVVLPDTINHPPVIWLEDTLLNDTIEINCGYIDSILIGFYDHDNDSLHLCFVEAPEGYEDWFAIDIDTYYYYYYYSYEAKFRFQPNCGDNTGNFEFVVCDTEFCDTLLFYIAMNRNYPKICHYLDDTTLCDTIYITSGSDTTINYVGHLWGEYLDSCSFADSLFYVLLDYPEPLYSWWNDSIYYGFLDDPIVVYVSFHLTPELYDTGSFQFKFEVCSNCYGTCDTCLLTVIVLPDSSCPAISEFEATPISSHEIDLSWAYSGIGNPDSVFLWRIYNEDTILLARLDGSITGYTDNSLAYATEYTYRISSWCATAGMSDFHYSSASTYYFRRDVDGFNFCNCGGVVWPYDDGTPFYPFPDWETFVIAYGEAQVLDPYGNPRPAALEFWNIMKGHWGGSCFGFTSVSLHLFGSTFPYDISDWGVESSIFIPLSDDIRRLINAEQIRQPYYSTYLSGGTVPDLYIHHYRPVPSEASALINDIENNMVNDLQNLCFFVWGWGGHSVTPYKLDTISTDEYRIYCYDNWSAHDDFYFEVNTSTGEIVYHREHYEPSTQSIDLIQLMPSRPFAQPPRMDFYSADEDKDLAFAGFGQGVRSISVKNLSTGDSSYFSIDTFYNTGEQLVILVPSDTLGGPSIPNWAIQLSAGNYFVQLIGDSIIGAKFLITTTEQLYAMNFPDLEYNDTITINVYVDGSSMISSTENREVSLSIAALLDTTYKNEGIYKISIPEFSGTLFTDIQIADSSKMKVVISKIGGDTILYDFQGILTDYSDPLSTQDTVLFPDSISLIPGEQQIINVFRGVNIWDGYIACDANADGIYEDTIFTTSSVHDNNLPVLLALNIMPNPFNSSLLINYDLSFTSNVSIEIYDITGHSVATLVNERKLAGTYTITWTPPDDIPSGIYFIRLKADDEILTRCAVLIR